MIGESFEGSTTAPGIRGTLGYDMRPVIFDEAERTDSASDSRIQALAEMIMIASSGSGKVTKGTANQQAIATINRSMFCLASINTALDRQGIARRITPLEVLRGDAEQFAVVTAGVEALPRGERLIARTMRHFKALANNI